MKEAELALPIKEQSKDVLMHAMDLAYGYTIGRIETVKFQDSRIVLIWELTHTDKANETLVLLREGRQFIGCRKSKGDFLKVVKYYRTKALEGIKHLLH